MKTPYDCPECKNGRMISVVEDYPIRTSDGNEIVVPEVELHRCESCGETVIPRASGKKIKEFKAQATEQLGAEELHAFFERADMTQKDFAEALGLGEKTFHRWLKGTQTVSRSMGYYLRAMDRFPEVFDWVKERGWRKTARRAAMGAETRNSGVVFAALHRRSFSREVSVSLARNPARALVLEAVHHQN